MLIYARLKRYCKNGEDGYNIAFYWLTEFKGPGGGGFFQEKI
jgi:hypothetical protein